jgi:transposase
VCQHLSVARVADGLGVAWNTANDAVLAEGKRVLINDTARFDGVTAIGVDEHVWRYTRRGDKYVTVIIDLTAVRAGTGPARLLDMVEGRSKQVFKTWLADRDEGWREAVEVVAMDGFTGFKTAAAEEIPTAVGRELMTKLIESVSTGVPKALSEVITVGRTLKKRAAEVLAYFDRPGTPTGPPRPSTAGSNTSAAAPSASAT